MLEHFKKKEFKNSSVLEYLLLKLLVADEDFFTKYPAEFERVSFELTGLEDLEFLRIVEGNVIVNETARNIFSANKKDKDLFDEFWELYHNTTNLHKTDREATKKKWSRLNSKEKSLASNKEILETYCFYTNIKYRKKARTYLEDKNFNDEYENTKDEWTQMK